MIRRAWIPRFESMQAARSRFPSGKAELGQGLKTALLQIAAEELKVPFADLTLITADTSLTADEGYTAASHSVQDSERRSATPQRRFVTFLSAKPLGASTSTIATARGQRRDRRPERRSPCLPRPGARPASLGRCPSDFAADGDGRLHRDELPGSTDRHPGKSYRRACVYPGYAPIRRVAWPDGAVAQSGAQNWIMSTRPQWNACRAW